MRIGGHEALAPMMPGDRDMNGIHRFEPIDTRHSQRIVEHRFGNAQCSIGVEQAKIQVDQRILLQALRSNQHL